MSGYSPEARLDMLNREKVCNCTKCPELVENRTQTVFGVGNPQAEIVFCGEGPGRDEDDQGIPFVGRAGKLLDNIIESLGLSRDEVYILNIVKCRPPSNRTPTPQEAANCRPYLNLQLKVIGPKYIVCLGACAAQNLLGSDDPIGILRGKWFDFQNGRFTSKLLATYHPAYLLRNPAAKIKVWEDLQLLVEALK